MDAKSAFVKRFGDLVTSFRVDPGNDAAQELALSAVVFAVAERAVEVEAAGGDGSGGELIGLRARMHARQVDRLHIMAGAHPLELEALARALAHDVTPVRSSPSIQVDFVRLLAPPSGPPAGDGGPTQGSGGEPDGLRAGELRAG